MAAQLRIIGYEGILDNCQKSVYWPDFCAGVQQGTIQVDWIPGALGRVVFNWAARQQPAQEAA